MLKVSAQIEVPNSRTAAIWSNWNTPKIGIDVGSLRSTKTCEISETVLDRTKVTMTD